MEWCFGEDCFRLLPAFDELDEHLFAVGPGNEEKIYAGSIRSRPRGGIDRRNGKVGTKNLRGAIDILGEKLHLLDAFPKFLEMARNSAWAASLASGQNIQADAARKVKFEFGGILVGRYFRKMR